MNATARARIQRGSGIYSCLNCNRQTRATGGNDNEHLRLCAECYELGGIENQIADEGETPALLAEVEKLKATIREKGGTL